MVEELKIYRSNKELENKNHLWLKPKKGSDGYNLLYYSVEGWKDIFTETPVLFSTEETESCICYTDITNIKNDD